VVSVLAVATVTLYAIGDGDGFIAWEGPSSWHYLAVSS
jgi:hypothetical protein